MSDTTLNADAPNADKPNADKPNADVKNILLVADYGPLDLAAVEVTQRLYELAAQEGLKVRVDYVSADSFDTTQTALLVGQGAHARDPVYDLVFHNTAPRRNSKKEQHNNSGEALAVTHVARADQADVPVVGVFSGGDESLNTFALLQQNPIYAVDCANEGTQFRSRDIYPQEAIKALKHRIATKGPRLDVPPGLADYETALGFGVQKLDALSDRRFAVHGDAAQGYATVIAPPEGLPLQLQAVAAHAPGTEIDALALKTDAGDKGKYGNGRWIEAGFAAAQLAGHAENLPPRTIFAFTDAGSSPQSVPLFEAVLDNGVTLFTDDVRTLAFAKTRIPDGQAWERTAEGSPIILDHAVLNERAPLPDTPTPAYIDGYGNVKLALTKEAVIAQLEKAHPDFHWQNLAPGERAVVKIQANGETVEATLTNGSFDLKPGELALSSGSSTLFHGEASGHAAEFFVRGERAEALFAHVQPGHEVSLTLERIVTPPVGDIVVGGRGASLEGPQQQQQIG